MNKACKDVLWRNLRCKKIMNKRLYISILNPSMFCGGGTLNKTFRVMDLDQDNDKRVGGSLVTSTRY